MRGPVRGRGRVRFGIGLGLGSGGIFSGFFFPRTVNTTWNRLKVELFRKNTKVYKQLTLYLIKCCRRLFKTPSNIRNGEFGTNNLLLGVNCVRKTLLLFGRVYICLCTKFAEHKNFLSEQCFTNFKIYKSAK